MDDKRTTDGPTPGPWEEQGEWIAGAVNDPEWLGDIVCIAPDGASRQYWEINRRLIAAAPAMLAALKMMVNAVGNSPVTSVDEAERIALEIIAKAEPPR